MIEIVDLQESPRDCIRPRTSAGISIPTGPGMTLPPPHAAASPRSIPAQQSASSWRTVWTLPLDLALARAALAHRPLKGVSDPKWVEVAAHLTTDVTWEQGAKRAGEALPANHKLQVLQSQMPLLARFECRI
jgi:hypothetical protein